MIIVSNKPLQFRANRLSENKSLYYVPGIANWRLSVHPQAWHPATDVYETEEKIIIRMEIAGMEEANFSISINQNILSISGFRTDGDDKLAFRQMEIFFGEFCVDIEIPSPIDLATASAEYKNGLLYIQLPKVLPKHIHINPA